MVSLGRVRSNGTNTSFPTGIRNPAKVEDIAGGGENEELNPISALIYPRVAALQNRDLQRALGALCGAQLWRSVHRCSMEHSAWAAVLQNVDHPSGAHVISRPTGVGFLDMGSP